MFEFYQMPIPGILKPKIEVSLVSALASLVSTTSRFCWNHSSSYLCFVASHLTSLSLPSGSGPFRSWSLQVLIISGLGPFRPWSLLVLVPSGPGPFRSWSLQLLVPSGPSPRRSWTPGPFRAQRASSSGPPRGSDRGSRTPRENRISAPILQTPENTAGATVAQLQLGLTDHCLLG